MNIPTTLKHKPVIVSDEYDKIDGRLAPDTDAKGLSLGLAQWNDRGNLDISAKIWRYTGEKWSRQSEEMPLHRVLDLAILICKARTFFKNRYRTNEKDFPEYPLLHREEIQGGAMNMSVCTENPLIEKDIELFEKCLQQDDEMLSHRLHTLLRVLKESLES